MIFLSSRGVPSLAEHVNNQPKPRLSLRENLDADVLGYGHIVDDLDRFCILDGAAADLDLVALVEHKDFVLVWRRLGAGGKD